MKHRINCHLCGQPVEGTYNHELVFDNRYYAFYKYIKERTPTRVLGEIGTDGVKIGVEFTI